MTTQKDRFTSPNLAANQRGCSSKILAIEIGRT
jgi:hypothetical protein